MGRRGVGFAAARRAAIAAAACGGLLIAAAPARAGFYFYTFETFSHMQFRGDAWYGYDIRYPNWVFWLELTPAENDKTGAVWYTQKQQIAAGFDTTFSFLVSDEVGGGADGLAFVIQNTSSNALGSGGGSMGYGGIADSLAVEYDTWQNPDDSPGDSHISVQTAGHQPNSPSATFSLRSFGPIPSLYSVHTSRIRYLPGTLQVYLDGGLVLSVATDLSSLLDLDEGKAWVGFTAATGGSAERHRLLSWTYTELPEPATLWFLAAAGLPLIARRRAGPAKADRSRR